MIEVTVKPDGKEPFEVTATARDVYLWERAYKGRSFAQFRRGEDMSMTMFYEVAHTACRRQGLFTGSLELFTETCELDFPAADAAEPDEVDPTQPDPSPAAS